MEVLNIILGALINVFGLVALVLLIIIVLVGIWAFVQA